MKQNIFSLTLFTIAMLVGGGLFAQTDCDPNGDGNPDGNPDTDGGGQGTGGTNNSGDLAWDLFLNSSTCIFSSAPGAGFGTSTSCINRNVVPAGSLEGRQSVKIAIIDSGILPTSLGFLNNSPLKSYTVSPTGVVTSGVAHPHPHGTYSAGVISGMLKGNNSTFYDYQVLDTDLRTSLNAVVAAIDHAVTNRVNVIALSIGFLPYDCDNIDWEDPASPLFAAIERARQADVVVITSAGNDGNDIEAAPQYPAAYASLNNLVSVGALTCDLEDRTPFSNYGANVVDVFTLGTYVQVYYNYCYYEIHGTSFSTSIVAGKAAIHFELGEDAEGVLCYLRGQTKPFLGNQLSIYGIVDVNRSNTNPGCTRSSTFPIKGKSLEEEGLLSLMTTPNPFLDQLRIQLGTEHEAVTISLLDGRGRRILMRRTDQTDLTLDLSHLSSGVYWLTVRDANGTQTRTVVKK